LRHILHEIHFIIEQSYGLDSEEFLANDVLKRAIVRSLEVIGEAVKRLPEELRERHRDIDWRAIAGTRDKLIHDYFDIDYEIVLDIIFNEIPQLQEQIQNLLHTEEGG
jgi:uncharacterized protein with HEPN domain